VVTRTGYYARTINRQKFLQVLYDELPDKARIYQGASVAEIRETKTGVTVNLADGRVFDGDMVVGADGVHSKVRRLMYQNVTPGSVNPRKHFESSYCAIVGLSRHIPGLDLVGAIETTSFKGVSFLWTRLEDEITFSVFIKLPAHQQLTEGRIRFTEDDLSEAVARIADFPLNENVKFGQLWAQRTRAHMVPLEEGVLDVWYSGRVVLAGDAVHKV
jgi:2-polyprenyl-6-methoxyphenol hydroxylase-like FAD-dependent oxidoreductase